MAEVLLVLAGSFIGACLTLLFLWWQLVRKINL